MSAVEPLQTTSTADAVLNALPHPVIVVSPDGKVIDANAAAEAFFEVSISLLRRHLLRDLVPFGSPLLTLIEQVRRRGAAVNEYKVDLGTPRNPGDRLVDLHVAPLPEQPGHVAVSYTHLNIWLFFYSPGYGLLDQVLGLFGIATHNWLGNEHTALACLIAVAVWKDAGFFMIFYLAALQQMSPRLAEAAALEGASRWYFFRRVTFPLLMPTTLFVLINAIINSFRLVDHIVVMTQGGPDNSTALLLFYIYEVGFKFWDTAYAATLTVALLTLLAILALGQFLILDRRIHYQ